MGKYLDLANSMKPGLAGGANENYPRELMQLSTIDLWQLNPDGTQALDANSQPIPVYDQETVRQVSLALTGWTYATAPGNMSQSVLNPPSMFSWFSPMYRVPKSPLFGPEFVVFPNIGNFATSNLGFMG